MCTIILAFVLVMFHRLDGHSLWVNRDNVEAVQGAGQIGYPTGTLINVGGIQHTVKEDVNEVIQKLRAAVDIEKATK